MGLPFPCGKILPKLVLTSAISLAAIKDFCRSFLRFLRLSTSLSHDEAFWQFAAHMELESHTRIDNWVVNTAFAGSNNARADTIQKSLPPVLSGLLLNQNSDWKRDGWQCAVCLSDIDGSQQVRQLPECSHNFHKWCIDGWLDQGYGTCPLCRRSVSVKEEVGWKESEERLEHETGMAN